jgi:hypothetical protein
VLRLRRWLLLLLLPPLCRLARWLAGLLWTRRG